MNEDLPLKIAILVLMVLMKRVRCPTRRLIGWKASCPGLKKNPLDTIILSICGLAWSFALVMYFFYPQRISFCQVDLSDWVRWGGVAAAVAAIGLLRWGDRCLGENLSITLQIKQNHTLVTTGPYRWIRHPIYAAALLFSATLFFISANWLVGLCFFGGIAILCCYRFGREEKMMIGRFGDEYRRYMERTGRVLPRIGRHPTGC